MACGLMLQPAGAATAAVFWPCLPLSAPRLSFPDKVQLNQVHCTNQLQWKQFLSAAKSYRSRGLIGCSSSDSSAEVAVLNRPADFTTAQSDQSMTRCVDLVPGALIVISGYWIGPDMDDGCGSVEAMLQRIL